MPKCPPRTVCVPRTRAMSEAPEQAQPSGPGPSGQAELPHSGAHVPNELDDALDEVFAELEGSEPEPDTEEVPEPEPEEPEGEDDPDEESEEPDEGDEGDEEPADEDDAEDDDEDESADEPNVIEVDDEEAVIRLPDGTEVPVKEGALRHADYTKKTQELAEQRKQFEQEREQIEARGAEVEELFGRMEAWYEQRAADPVSWIGEIAQDSGDTTRILARAVKALNEQGLLDPEFVEVFRLEHNPVIEQAAAQGEQQDRLTRLEREAEERKQAEQAQRQREELARQYLQNWSELTAERGVEFASPQEERELRNEVITFAHQNGITNLEVAYDALDARRARTSPAPTPAPPARDEETAQKKRATRATAARSTRKTSKATPKAPMSTEDAALASLEEYAQRA